MKKLITLLLTIVMAICLINLNNSQTKAEDDEIEPLTLTCVSDGGCKIQNFKWLEIQSGTNVEFKTKGLVDPEASDWQTYSGGKIDFYAKGASVSFRAHNLKTADNSSKRFVIDEDSGDFEASGDVTSLTNGIGGDTPLSNGCYEGMFADCTHLITAPNLPSTTLADNCYSDMFRNSGIVKAPELPATSLSKYCYKEMFKDCSSLTTLPTLPATSLTTKCYYKMFNGCTSLQLSENNTGVYKYPYRIPTQGIGTKINDSLEDMFLGIDSGGGTLFTGTPSINTIYYVKNEPTPPIPPQPEPTPSPSEPVVKDESCEKVIGPTWHWNESKGICEDYGVVGTSTRGIDSK